MLSAMSISVSVTVTHDAVCSYGGRIEGYINGGTPPYQLVLATGQQITAPSAVYFIEGVPAGSNTITVTDATLQTASEVFQIQARSSFYEGFAFPLPNCGQGTVYGMVSNTEGIYPTQSPWNIAGMAPLTINGAYIPVFRTYPSCWNADYLVEFYGPPNSDPGVINYVDANGCPGTIGSFIPGITTLPTVQILDLVGSCSNRNNGSIVITTVGGVIWESTLRFKVFRADGTQVDAICGYSGGFSITQLPVDLSIPNLPPGSYYLRMQAQHYTEGSGNWNSVGVPSTCVEDIPFTIPNLGPCALITGTAFIDSNLDCAFQSSEPRVPNAIIEVLPGPYYATTSSGNYAVALPASGPYTLTLQHPTVEEHCVNAPIPVTATVGSTAVKNIAMVSTVPLDVSVTMASGPARPGFQLNYGLQVRNLTLPSTGNTTLTMVFDPALTYTGATPTPTNVSGNTITWSQTAFSTNVSTRNYSVQLQVPPDVGLLGTQLLATANIATANVDGFPANNTAIASVTVTGSYDPNDKLAVTSTGDTQFWNLGQDEWIDYTVRFQNTGSDTAFSVVIRDTLPATLDPSTLEMRAASHAYTWNLTGQGVLKAFFPNIKLPDSNVNEPKSHGFVSFRIKPRLPVTAGMQLTNVAGIYFDFNPPVITDPSILTVASPGALVAPKVFLGGPYSGSGLMNDGLRAQSLIPLQEPYTALGYQHIGGGGETTSGAVRSVTGNNAIVDWVVVELRSAAQPAMRIATRSALVQRDGDVVGTNGVLPVAFNVPAGNYRVAIRHRNHLIVMTGSAISLSGTVATVNFTLPATSTYGTNAQQNINGNMVLWPGDGNANGTVQYTGIGNDRDPVLVGIGGSVATNTVTNVYSPLDINMNGTISYTGLNNDRDVILQTIGGVVATATRVQQLP